jgi:fatty acid desaturase
MTPLDRELCAAVADLGGAPSWIERAWTVARLLGLSGVLIGGSCLWMQPLGWPSGAMLIITGAAYALLLIATHEMVHGTLLGWRRFETTFACLLSWPMGWPYLTYARLHRLHHLWNGRDPRDPERTDVLPMERLHASPLRRQLQSHLLPLRILVFGGVGLIADTTIKGLQLQHVDPRLGLARLGDGIGVVVVHTAMLSIAVVHGEIWRYLLFWLVLERVIGGIVQLRGLVEHHGLWQQHNTNLQTQLYSSRNIRCSAWFNALMGGLPHHSAHHAFPWLCSARLPEGSARIAAVLARHGVAPTPLADSYAAALQLLRPTDAPCSQSSPGSG